MIPAVFLMGPTASGKTDWALRLADQWPVDLISVDSLLVYRHFDVGSAKPERAVLARYPHALIDIREPEEAYSAGDFRRDALAAIQMARRAGRIPLLVGGTGLYFRAVERGIGDLPGANAALREQLAAEAAQRGWPALHARLAAVDPSRAAQIHPQDQQRIQRALELHAAGGSSASWQEDFPGPRIKIALLPQRTTLHQRIADRLAQMMTAGFPEEVQALQGRYGDQDLPAMRAVGYRQLWAWAEGNSTLDQARERALYATRQLAKRQATWLRAETLDLVLDPQDPAAWPQALQHIRGELVAHGAD